LVYANYIKKLDENRNYFLAEDIAEFDKFKYTFDDDLKAGNLNRAFYIFNVYQKRYADRINYSLSQINKEFNFNTNEKFTFDRADQPWISTSTDLNKNWDLRVKYDLLNLKLANNDLAKGREALKKRYEGQLAQVDKLNS